MGVPLVTPVDPAGFCPIRRPDDPRLAERAQRLVHWRELPDDAIVLIGVPDDRGVQAGYGRAGAAMGPKVFRECFYRLPLGASGELERLAIYDAGDLILGGSPEIAHENLARVVARLGARAALTCVIGGGHDATYGSVKGLMRARRGLGVINIDAHLDVRPPEASGLIGSGTAFRRLMEEGILPGPQLAMFGVQRHATAPQHWRFARSRGVRLWESAELESAGAPAVFAGLVRDLVKQFRRVAVSLDLDAVAAADAPGVSAINPTGLSAQVLIRCMGTAGAEPGVRHLDIMELNPRFDIDGKTARLAALSLWTFCAARAGVCIPASRRKGRR